MRLVDGVEDRLVHGGVKPIHDAMVVHHPVAVTLGERRRRVDVVVEAELANHGVEEAPPLDVVRFHHVEEHWNM